MSREQANPTNSESSGAQRVGVANSGQNEFPLKKDAQEAAEQNGKQQGPASAGSQERAAAKHVDSGQHSSNNDSSSNQ